ncbi:MAG: ABC transporter substrate-binding protein [Rhodospirillaceae bacterium]|nr:ABC transporter substrate-binding protein [Rhodospirillaceae bacterium]
MMGDIPITIATGDYDRTRPIRDGRVAVEGCDVTYLPMEAGEIFFRALRHQEFDVCELSFSNYMTQKQRGVAGYIAIPVFLSRIFRHSGIYIRTDRGIDTPEDLRGRTVGVQEYPMTAAVWQRGMLQDEYGVAPGDIRWRTGGMEQPGRVERTPFIPPDGVDVTPIPVEATLSAMFEDGELDALITPGAPSCFHRGAPNIGRLFPDYRAAEQAYYAKTGLHPIMHLVVVRESLAERYPWLCANLYKAFREAKRLAIADLEKLGTLALSLPWVGAELEATRALLGDDFWPYGVTENARDIETLIRYSFEQGLTERRLEVEELFAASTFDVSKF